MLGRQFLTAMGTSALTIARDTGGIVVLLGQVLRALVPPSVDGRTLRQHIYTMGNQSLLIVSLTAFFTGALMSIQSGVLVQQFGATGLLGFAGGYAVFRELGPILIALMFSGRVGSNNTAELGTMTVTEQLDGLRALAIDPIRYLIVPRVVAMVLSLFMLTIIGDLIALLGSTAFALLMFDVTYPTLHFSLFDNLAPVDYLHGLTKSAVFGLAIGLTSCYFGITVRGGAVGVGRAVNASVVAAAVSVLILDFVLTYFLP